MVARKYLTGTTNTSISNAYFKESKRDFDDLKLSDNLILHSELPKTIITPTTKAKNDKNVNNQAAIEHLKEQLKKDNAKFADAKSPLQKAVNKLGSVEKLYLKLKEITTESFNAIHNKFKSKGLIVPDIKFEFGVDNEGEIYMMDEKGSPDSLRIWDKNEWEKAIQTNTKKQKLLNKVEISPKELAQVEASFDKDFLRRIVNSSKGFESWKNSKGSNGTVNIKQQIQANQNHKDDESFTAYDPPLVPGSRKKKLRNMQICCSIFTTI